MSGKIHRRFREVSLHVFRKCPGDNLDDLFAVCCLFPKDVLKPVVARLLARWLNKISMTSKISKKSNNSRGGNTENYGKHSKTY